MLAFLYSMLCQHAHLFIHPNELKDVIGFWDSLSPSFFGGGFFFALFLKGFHPVRQRLLSKNEVTPYPAVSQ